MDWLPPVRNAGTGGKEGEESKNAASGSDGGHGAAPETVKAGVAPSASVDAVEGVREVALGGSSEKPEKADVVGAGSGKRTLRVAVEGCCHGELDRIYESIVHLRDAKGVAIDLLIICGDFQAVRNEEDLETMACPVRFRDMRTFYKYYSGERVAPVLTVFIGGNHEASNHLQELYYGGWVAPNIFYLGNSGVVQVAGVRIGGLSGIFKQGDYNRGYTERPPYTPGSMRSVYHTREIEVYKLLQMSAQLDVLVSHDWPRGIAHFGDTQQLLRRKKFLAKEVHTNTLGSPPSEVLLQVLQPKFWFAAHLHTKFAALVRHPPGTGNRCSIAEDRKRRADELEAKMSSADRSSEAAAAPDARVSRFLALDKCLPGRDFLQVLELDVPQEHEDSTVELCYDEEWLAVVTRNQKFLTTRPRQGTLPPATPISAAEIVDVRRRLRFAGLSKPGVVESFVVPRNFEVTVPPYAPGGAEGGHRRHGGGVRQPPQRGNPQTDSFVAMLGLSHVVTVPCVDPRKDRPVISASSPAAPATTVDPAEISIDDAAGAAEVAPPVRFADDAELALDSDSDPPMAAGIAASAIGVTPAAPSAATADPGEIDLDDDDD